MIKELLVSDICFSFDIKEEDILNSKLEIVGQERALKALRTGLKTNRSGYNIFISGESGTGKLSSVRQEINRLCHDDEFIKDVVYLANPINQNSPIALCLDKGDGKKLKELFKDLNESNYYSLLDKISNEIPKARDYTSLLSRYTYKEEYKYVNLVLDRSGESKRPFIIDSHPSFENLFGYVDKDAKYAQMSLHIGSYAAASGGFLVLTAEEVLSQKGLFDAIKRHLDATNMALTTKGVQGSIGKEERLRPEPIGLLTKVILLGSEDIYDELCQKDEAFTRLFKVSPQFDYQMEKSEENIRGTIGYIKNIAPNIEQGAIEEILRFSSQLCESRYELTTQFSLLGDLLCEAMLKSDKVLTKKDILETLSERMLLTDILEERINNEIKSGEILISTSGKKVGIINGLAVMDRGNLSFGTPTCISVTVAPGSEGIVNIEHEAGLSGEIHDKGVLILEGYLRKNYARSFPLSIYAGICFEQNYNQIDGDSASSCELYALLSAIGEIPIRQDIAITGSVNQMGVLQPVSGINEKITGFFHTCKSCGLTGEQGVIIPKQNIKSLILPYEVEESIREGSFHLWALSTIEEGMSLLTGLENSSRDKRGYFKVGSFNRIIEDRLKRLYESGKGN